MRTGKNRKIIMVIFCFVMLMTGCDDQKDDNRKSQFQDQKQYLNMSTLVEADEGVYYIQWDEEYSLMKYVDKETAKETALCQKINCKHNSNECSAVVERPKMMGFMAYSDDNIYFMTIESGMESLKVYCMKPDGTDKKLVHEFKNQSCFPNQAGLYKGKLFLSVPTMLEFEDGTGSSSAEPSVIMYDIEKKEERVIVDGEKEKGQFTIPVGGSGESIYLMEIEWNAEDGNGLLLKQYNWETEEMSVVYEGKREDIQFVINDTIYLWPEGEKCLEAYNLQSKERQTVFEWDEEVSAVYPRAGHVELMKEVQNGEEVKQIYNWYDLEEKKYLFQEYQGKDKVNVKLKMSNGYWVQKENGSQCYFYDLQNETWEKIEEIE